MAGPPPALHAPACATSVLKHLATHSLSKVLPLTPHTGAWSAKQTHLRGGGSASVALTAPALQGAGSQARLQQAHSAAGGASGTGAAEVNALWRKHIHWVRARGATLADSRHVGAGAYCQAVVVVRGAIRAADGHVDRGAGARRLCLGKACTGCPGGGAMSMGWRCCAAERQAAGARRRVLLEMI